MLMTQGAAWSSHFKSCHLSSTPRGLVSVGLLGDQQLSQKKKKQQKTYTQNFMCQLKNSEDQGWDELLISVNVFWAAWEQFTAQKNFTLSQEVPFVGCRFARGHWDHF